MLRTEMVDGRIRHYSDSGMMILQEDTGIMYEDAVDNVSCPHTYVETNQPSRIPLTAEEALDILLGVT